MSVSRQGFSLLEVMAALAIMGLVLVALSGLKVALLRSVARDTAELERSFVLENFFVEQKRDYKWYFSNGGWIYFFVWFIVWIVFYNL